MSARAQHRGAVDEVRDEPAGGLIVEYYRVDPSRSLVRALGSGAFVLTAGALLMAVAILLPRFDGRPHIDSTTARAAAFRGRAVTAEGAPITSRTSGWELALGMVGLALIAAGGGIAITGLRRAMREERYLALRTDGACFRDGGATSLLRWEDVEEVRWEDGVVAFVRHDGAPWIRAERFAGVDGRSLAKRAGEVRRKALFGLLR